ncbi:hypothetical protein M406DRAFT_321126 [Cryphonectria parasitica EP155]|uniref:Secreted protein n=1 Tax=Cryphonectria parasitica (strain ATCC 38755 / EP155) TaxID=660469 RepID=A0A9P4Y8Q8_CRYP1|nr:uncharacterized protein M406DRAFT_321126 [Cryphonectria parasitica EP155]KAF3769044.1 hypothetical protein M406DRAFT_321126 [Cryphonectria parasitica EP155]
MTTSPLLLLLMLMMLIHLMLSKVLKLAPCKSAHAGSQQRAHDARTTHLVSREPGRRTTCEARASHKCAGEGVGSRPGVGMGSAKEDSRPAGSSRVVLGSPAVGSHLAQETDSHGCRRQHQSSSRWRT